MHLRDSDIVAASSEHDRALSLTHTLREAARMMQREAEKNIADNNL